MINFDDYENKTEHNLKWPYIQDHPYRILITGGFGSGKTNALLNLINNQLDIDKIYLYVKHTYEAKYQFLLNKRQSTGSKHLMIQKLLLSIQMICKMKMFIRILKNTLQVKNIKY